MKRIEALKRKYEETGNRVVIYDCLSEFLLGFYDMMKKSIDENTDFRKTTIEECDGLEMSLINAEIYRGIEEYFEEDDV